MKELRLLKVIVRKIFGNRKPCYNGQLSLTGCWNIWYIHTHTHIHTYIYTTSILAKLSTWCFEHSGDISCSLLVNPSHTDESWEGRNTCMWICGYMGHSPLTDSLNSYRKLAWRGFEPTTTDALTDWAVRPWVQLALRANFVQLLQFHRLFSVTFHFGCLPSSVAMMVEK